MLNPDPQKYLGLRDGFNALGRELFPETWTGTELDARDLPKLKELRGHIDEAEATAKKKAEEDKVRRAEHAKRAIKASVGVHAGSAQQAGGGATPGRPRSKAAPPDQSQRKQDEWIALRNLTTVEVVRLARDEAAYRVEYDARQRREQTDQAYRTALYSGQPKSVLLNAHDGRPIDIPRRLWLSELFRVSFAQGTGGWTTTGTWTDNEGRGAIEYSGSVWTERGDGLPVSGEGTPTAAAGDSDAKSHEAEADVPTSVGAPADRGAADTEASSLWWPRTPEKQSMWRSFWANALEAEPDPAKWNVTSIATKLAKKELGVRTATEASERLATTIRKYLGKMRPEGGPPEK